MARWTLPVLLLLVSPALGLTATEGDLTRLTTASTVEGSPAWAGPATLAYVSEGSVSTVADWGPKTPKDFQGRTWVFDPSPLSSTPVRAYSATLGVVASVTQVAVSRDGTMLAFVSSHRSVSPDLWTSRLDGTEAKPIYAEPTSEASPAWSPDGKSIWVASQGRLLRVDAEKGSATRVYAIAPPTAIEDYRDPAPSPDGKSVAFVARLKGEVAYDLWIMGADGSDPRRLTQTAQAEARPSWFPDGTRLAVQTDQGLSIVKADGSGAEAVATSPALAKMAQPAVSPDGSSIAFVSDYAGSDDIWLLKMPGPSPTPTSAPTAAPTAAAPSAAAHPAPTPTPKQPGMEAGLAAAALLALGLFIRQKR